MRLLLTLMLCALAGGAWAQPGSVTLTCTPPVQNTDGSPLTNLASYRYLWGTTQGTYPSSKLVPSSAGCGTVITGLAPATWYFVVTAVNTNGVESALSNVASKLVSGAPPNPPTVPQPVTIAGPVFNLGITDNSMVLLEAGSVVAGRSCDPTQQIAFNGQSYMRVNVASVAPFPGQQILTAWAKCQ